jgi:hypothetical protein
LYREESEQRIRYSNRVAITPTIACGTERIDRIADILVRLSAQREQPVALTNPV